MEDRPLEPVFVQEHVEKDPAAVVSWSGFDTWLGFGIYVTLVVCTLLLVLLYPDISLEMSFLAGFEFMLLIPVAVIFLWRRISWKELGFRSFDWGTIGLGCGALVIAYTVIIIHNLILAMLGVITQGDTFLQAFAESESPVPLLFSGIVLAPIMEEIFFRGFLFRGFRQRYGVTTALLLSSFLFALSHLHLSAMLPTFLFGCVMAFMAHRSNSVFPGMIMHFLINSLGMCIVFASYKLGAF